jgi:para-aminobenzoate synthetase component I
MQTTVEELENPPRPVDALARLGGLPYPILLESVSLRPSIGRYSYLTADPFEVIRHRVGDAGERGASGDPFARLRNALALHDEPTIPGLPPFQGGAAGYFGYELGGELERIPRPGADDLRLPDMLVGLYDWTLAWDHETARCWLISTGLPEHGGPRADRARQRADQILDHLSREAPPERTVPPRSTPALSASFPVEELPGVASGFTHAGYLEGVRRVRDYILAGDIFQANLSQRLQAPVSRPPRQLYLRLRESSPAPYAAFFDLGEAALVSASPELFLRARGSAVETRPIKGTAPRSDDPETDAASARALLRSEKDRAENVMIVDLLRNDLSRVCTDASVDVPRLCEIESHGPVHHLVSTVTGRLRSDCDVIDLLCAAFPGGSITGAPKIRAMEVIAELEPTRRGPYTGSLGFIGFDGSMETSILIRTFVVRDGMAFFQVGGGIVADSDPEREYRETLYKAAGLFAALEEPAWS